MTRVTKERSPLLVRLFAGLVLSASTVVGTWGVELEPVARSLSRPLYVTHAGDGTGRLFIVEQGGRIRILDNGRVLPQPFLDLSGEITSGGERGLLGLAFHPRYSENGFFFVNYSDRRGDTVISRFAVSADPDRADRSSEVEVLTFGQPFANHNGGHLTFGPDGYLYIGSGDGGSAGDPQNNAQRLDTLLGKILRVDIDGLPLAIPPDNPFVGRAGARPEIWAHGLRNPWRFSFDRWTGDLFIGDVGQNREEEIDLQRATSSGGENYGWRRKEGSLCFDPASGCENAAFTEPILVYGRNAGCSVTGGYRYRGSDNPELIGTYVFGDFCTGTIWGARPVGGAWSASLLVESGASISSFGEDEAGELYIVDLDGAVLRFAGSALLADDFESAETGLWNSTRGEAVIVQPGLGGSDHALAVTVDGARNRSLVLTKAVRRESALSVRFLLRLDDLDLAGREVEFVRLAGNRGMSLVWMTLTPRRSKFRASLWIRTSAGDSILVGSTVVPAAREVKLGFDWQRASGPSAVDGMAQLVKGGRARSGVTSLGDSPSAPRSLRLGLPAGSTGALGGVLVFDDVVISR